MEYIYDYIRFIHNSGDDNNLIHSEALNQYTVIDNITLYKDYLDN